MVLGGDITDNIIYKTDIAKIAEDRMEWNIVHRRPKFRSADKNRALIEAEKKLFDIFSKYCTGDPANLRMGNEVRHKDV